MTMRVINRFSSSAIITSSETPLTNFPIAYLRDDYPKRRVLWDAETIHTVDITTTISGGVTALGLVNVTADDIEITVRDPNEYSYGDSYTLSDGYSFVSYEAVPSFIFTERDFSLSKAVWATFTAMSLTEVTITLSKGSWKTDDEDRLGVGCLIFGEQICTRSFTKGLNETLVDLGIEDELADGGYYYFQKDTVRQFSGNMFMDFDSEFYEFFLGFLRLLGRKPTLWWLSDQLGMEWVVFLRQQNDPTVTYSHNSMVNLQITLREVL